MCRFNIPTVVDITVFWFVNTSIHSCCLISKIFWLIGLELDWTVNSALVNRIIQINGFTDICWVGGRRLHRGPTKH